MKWRNSIVVVLQVLFLLLILFSHYSVVLTGEEITLKSRPIDPYDIFRGAYVTLSYEEESIPEGMLSANELSNGDLLYVTFKRKGEVHIVDQVLQSPPKQKLFLTARYLYTHSGFHHVDYQLDRYYTNEKEALDLEKQARERLLIHVIVKSGRGIVRGITVLPE
jgi:uncharacterized membrane-anchored protein